MSLQGRGPAYPLALIAGALILLGGLVRETTIGILPRNAYGMTYKAMSNLLRTTSIGIGPGLNQLSATIGIVSGIIVLVGAVMLSSRVENNVPWGIGILTFSVIGFLGGGGFIAGSVLGMLAGIIAITWTPVSRTV